MALLFSFLASSFSISILAECSVQNTPKRLACARNRRIFVHRKFMWSCAVSSFITCAPAVLEAGIAFGGVCLSARLSAQYLDNNCSEIDVTLYARIGWKLVTFDLVL